MNETEKRSFYESYSNSCHWIGRIGLAVGIIMMLGAPLVMGLVLGTGPDWGSAIPALLQVAAVYWVSSIAEFLVYAPLLGTASYVAFITGNLVNLKLPCTVNAREICGTRVGTPENDIVSTLSVATSSLVTVTVLAVGVLCLVPLTPVLQAPALQPAFNNVIPALFGALAYKYFFKSLRLTAVPLVVMCLLFVLVPALLSQVSILILLGGGIALAVGYFLYRKDKL